MRAVCINHGSVNVQVVDDPRTQGIVANRRALEDIGRPIYSAESRYICICNITMPYEESQVNSLKVRVAWPYTIYLFGTKARVYFAVAESAK